MYIWICRELLEKTPNMIRFWNWVTRESIQNKLTQLKPEINFF